MLDEKLIKVLAKIYRFENGKYDLQKGFYHYAIPTSFPEKSKQILAESGFEINKIVLHSHDEVIKALKKCVETENLEQKVKNLFFKALAEGFHRGLQPLFSYYFAKNMPLHTHQPFTHPDRSYEEGECPCKICGIPQNEWDNDSKNLYDLYIGYCRLGGYAELLLDLEEVIQSPEIKRDKNGEAIFLQLLDLIKQAPPKETPSELIARISKAKILPKSNNTSRTWLVRILAETGILPNKLSDGYSIFNQFYSYDQRETWYEILFEEAPNHRVEVNFPISAWRGQLGINEEMAKKLLEV